ncbi:MAG: hypothetical protein ACRDZZ_04625 [Ilumatobacteraceae bacterium]
MTTTTTTTTTATTPPIDRIPAVTNHDEPRVTTRDRDGRETWALWGALASVSGAVATLFTINPDLDQAVLGDPAATIAALDHTTYHIGVVAGLVTVAAHVFAAAGWRRRADDRAPRSIAASVVSMALLASASAMVIAYGLKGTLANYLPGGSESDMGFTDDGLYAVFTVLDFAPFFAWWGVAVAAGAAGWLALVERLLPRWIGVLGLTLSVVPAVALAATGIPGLPFVSMGWLLATSIGVALGGDSTSRAS